MRTNIKTTDIKLTPGIREYVEKKIAALDKYIDPDDTTVFAEVEIGRTTEHHQKGRVFRAEIQVSTKGEIFRADSERETLNDAIDSAQSDMARELRRHKNKRADLFRRGATRMKRLFRGEK